MGKFQNYKYKNFHAKGIFSLIGICVMIIIILVVLYMRSNKAKKKENKEAEKRTVSRNINNPTELIDDPLKKDKKETKEILSNVRYAVNISKEVKKWKKI